MNRSELDSRSRPLRLLFVCSGNTCRSPMAQVIAQVLAEDSDLGQVEVRSAGTHARDGSPASEEAVRAARRHGHSLEDHRSAQLSRRWIDWADLIFTMGPSHLERVRALGGGEKAFLLGAFARGEEGEEGGVTARDRSVPDPFGGDEQVYEETFLTLEEYLTALLDRLKGGTAP